MKKILAFILAAFFVVLSPISAYASTTESMMLFSLQQDDYAVMPLASVDSTGYTQYVGYYNALTDSRLSSSSHYNISSGDEIFLLHTNYPNFNYQPSLYPFSSLAFYSLSLPVEEGSNIRLVIGNYFMSIYDSVNEYFLNNNMISPFQCFAKIEYSATGQIGNTHSGGWTSSNIINISSSFLPTDFSQYSFMIDSSIPVTLPSLDSWVTSNSSSSSLHPERVYNVKINYIQLYFYLPVNSSFTLRDGTPFNVNTHLNTSIGLNFQHYGSSNPGTFFILYDDNVGSPSSSSSFSGIQNSISSVSRTLATGVNQIKTQLTQSTNTITTKIDTMANDVKTGLQNVVTSAQQNTQNIINTVTQKVDQVKETVSEVKDSILDLPNKIQEMLLGLIVPDSDTMASKYEEFSGLLEEKLGVIYQIPMMLFDFFDTIVNAATTPQTSLTLPAFTLPWIDGSTLTVWNSMEYKIIPDGLEVLSDLIKTVTSMTVVVLTFNSVKRAYERFLRS